jgi:hypothetical protein
MARIVTADAWPTTFSRNGISLPATHTDKREVIEKMNRFLSSHVEKTYS